MPIVQTPIFQNSEEWQFKEEATPQTDEMTQQCCKGSHFYCHTLQTVILCVETFWTQYTIIHLDSHSSTTLCHVKTVEKH
jgi:hypothetical protein